MQKNGKTNPVYLTFSQRRKLADWMEKNQGEVKANSAHAIARSASADVGCECNSNHVLSMAKELGMKTGGRSVVNCRNNDSKANQIVWLAKIVRKLAKLDELTDDESRILDKIVARGSFASESNRGCAHDAK